MTVCVCVCVCFRTAVFIAVKKGEARIFLSAVFLFVRSQYISSPFSIELLNISPLSLSLSLFSFLVFFFLSPFGFSFSLFFSASYLFFSPISRSLPLPPNSLLFAKPPFIFSLYLLACSSLPPARKLHPRVNTNRKQLRCCALLSFFLSVSQKTKPQKTKTTSQPLHRAARWNESGMAGLITWLEVSRLRRVYKQRGALNEHVLSG